MLNSPALTQAEAQIIALGNATRARTERINTDPRIIGLRKAIHGNTIITEDGERGGAQLFTALANGRLAAKARATRLLRARIAQLDHNPAGVRYWLRDAVACRGQA